MEADHILLLGGFRAFARKQSRRTFPVHTLDIDSDALQSHIIHGIRVFDVKEDPLSERMLNIIDNLCSKVCHYMFLDKTEYQRGRRDWSLRGT